MGRVIVGLSGGVDSAVAALRLKQAGQAVEGLFMFNWTADEDGYCQAADDFAAAQAVADHLDIVLHRADFSAEYHDRVFRHFLDEYAAGRTPNPDLLCNREIKFAPFRDYALRLGADAVATGHYARTRDGRLYRAEDAGKDQTYFLALVTSAQLDRVVFPLGDLTKPEVRAMADQHGLPNAQRPDSTGICFIGERDFGAFIASYLDDAPGDIVDTSGRVIGRHRGLFHHTIGQRRGLGIGGVAGAADAPWFVCGKNMTSRQLIVTQDTTHPALAGRRLRTGPVNWIGDPPALPARLTARIRHRQPLLDCRVSVAEGGANHGGVDVMFDTSPWAIAAGQYVVLYDDTRCLGGAVIADALDAPGGDRPA